MQIKDDEWAPYARMKSHIGVDNYDCGQSIGRNETEKGDREESIGESSFQACRTVSRN